MLGDVKVSDILKPASETKVGERQLEAHHRLRVVCDFGIGDRDDLRGRVPDQRRGGPEELRGRKGHCKVGLSTRKVHASGR